MIDHFEEFDTSYNTAEFPDRWIRDKADRASLESDPAYRKFWKYQWEEAYEREKVRSTTESAIREKLENDPAYAQFWIVERSHRDVVQYISLFFLASAIVFIYQDQYRCATASMSSSIMMFLYSFLFDVTRHFDHESAAAHRDSLRFRSMSQNIYR